MKKVGTILLMAILISLLFSVPVEAKAKRKEIKKALAAYDNFYLENLDGKQEYYTYTYAERGREGAVYWQDINNDKMPEFILKYPNKKGKNTVEFFVYKKNKVVKLRTKFTDVLYVINDQEYSGKSIVLVRGKTMKSNCSYEYYTIKRGKIKKLYSVKVNKNKYYYKGRQIDRYTFENIYRRFEPIAEEYGWTTERDHD